MLTIKYQKFQGSDHFIVRLHQPICAGWFPSLLRSGEEKCSLVVDGKWRAMLISGIRTRARFRLAIDYRVARDRKTNLWCRRFAFGNHQPVDNLAGFDWSCCTSRRDGIGSMDASCRQAVWNGQAIVNSVFHCQWGVLLISNSPHETLS